MPEGFDFFDVPESQPSPELQLRMEVEKKIGEMGSLVSAQPLLKPAGISLLKQPGVTYYRHKRAWMIEVDADTEQEAKRKGQRVQQNLVGKRSLSSSDPYLHQLPLYVIFNTGWVVLEGIPERVKEHGTSLPDLKRDILRRGKGFFGASGVSLGGREGAYTLTLRPALKEHRGKFGPGSFRAETLEELSQKLDQAIEQVEKILASRVAGRWLDRK
jgi:hypothetical protein